MVQTDGLDSLTVPGPAVQAVVETLIQTVDMMDLMDQVAVWSLTV